MSKIDSKKLKEMVGLINNSGLLDKIKEKNIRTVGVKMDSVLNEFGDVVDKLADADLQTELDPAVIAYYNEAFDDDEEPVKEKEEPVKEKEEPAAEKPKKDKKKKSNPAAAKPRSCYGHIASAKSGALDEMLSKGATYADLMKDCDVALHRVKGHINVLKKKGLTLLVKEDKEDSKNTHVQIKEDSI